MTDSPTIHAAMAAVLRDLPAVGKNQRNQQQGFSFRGIDDVLDALNPALAKHGVFFVPQVLERLESDRQTQRGGTMWVVDLHVQYTFFGPAGDSVVASGWGQGTDSGDKATQKAMTGALKYVLFQVFAIATHEQADADADLTTPEPTSRPRGSKEDLHASESSGVGSTDQRASGVSRAAASDERSAPETSPARRQKLKSRCSALLADGAEVVEFRHEWKLPTIDESDDHQLGLWEELCTELEARLAAPFVKADA